MLQDVFPPSSISLRRARRLRMDQTLGEIALWRQVRFKRFRGLKFRRQVPLGPFIADFLCLERNLIIEIDGETHGLPGAKRRDQRREKYLREHGFHILRFANAQATEAMEEVLQSIGEWLKHHPNPSP